MTQKLEKPKGVPHRKGDRSPAEPTLESIVFSTIRTRNKASHLHGTCYDAKFASSGCKQTYAKCVISDRNRARDYQISSKLGCKNYNIVMRLVTTHQKVRLVNILHSHKNFLRKSLNSMRYDQKRNHHFSKKDTLNFLYKNHIYI